MGHLRSLGAYGSPHVHSHAARMRLCAGRCDSEIDNERRLKVVRIRKTGKRVGDAYATYRRETTQTWVARIEQSLNVR